MKRIAGLDPNGKFSRDFFNSLFASPRADHPGQRGSVDNPRSRGGHGRMVSGNSKYHRKMVKQGQK